MHLRCIGCLVVTSGNLVLLQSTPTSLFQHSFTYARDCRMGSLDPVPLFFAHFFFDSSVYLFVCFLFISVVSSRPSFSLFGFFLSFHHVMYFIRSSSQSHRITLDEFSSPPNVNQRFRITCRLHLRRVPSNVGRLATSYTALYSIISNTS
jgi:hypothetical protein